MQTKQTYILCGWKSSTAEAKSTTTTTESHYTFLKQREICN